MDRNYSIDEQETTINIFPSAVSKQAEIFTCIPLMMKKLRKLAGEYPSDVSLAEHDGCITATVPVGWVRVMPKRKCNLTDEQKRANTERLAKYMEAKKNDAT